MVIDFSEARKNLTRNAKARHSATLLTVVYDADGKLSVVLGREASQRFDRAFGEGESTGLHTAVSTELQEALRASGARADVLRKVV